MVLKSLTGFALYMLDIAIREGSKVDVHHSQQK
jgi:hypothetical protein